MHLSQGHGQDNTICEMFVLPLHGGDPYSLGVISLVLMCLTAWCELVRLFVICVWNFHPKKIRGQTLDVPIRKLNENSK